MDDEEIIVCERHQKKQKKLNRIPANYFICMNQHCPNSFTMLCQNCKSQHRDHTLKVLSIEDMSFLVEKLIKTPFKQVSKYITECIDMMRKFKLIREFKKKIDRLQSQIQKEVIGLLDISESLVSEYAESKKASHIAAQKLYYIDQPDVLADFKNTSREILSKIEYNFKKDRLEYAGPIIKNLEDQRKKSLNISKKKIQEVKDYSMKIIEVILNCEDSDEDQEQIIIQKKMYEVLKQQIFSFDLKLQEKEQFAEGHTKSTLETPKNINKVETASQTTNQWMGQEKKIKNLYQRINQLEDMHSRTETDLKNKIAIVEREKEKILKQKQRQKNEYAKKKVQLLQFYDKILQNKIQRKRKNEEKNQMLQKLYSVVLEQNQQK